MAKLSFTKHQQEAVDVLGGNILVSAAAGSGKTAVLSERVIKLLTGENPVAADKLVIVTFAVSAANEMRRRINDKLIKKLEENPNSELLQNQQLLLSNAKISSIHSLCSGLIRDNFQVLGISNDIKIAEETELNLIKSDAVNEVLESRYDSGNSDFLSLVEFTCTKDDQKLISLILSIYNFIRSFSFPLDFLQDAQKMYDNAPSIEKNQWTGYVTQHIIDALDNCIDILKDYIEDMSIDETVFEKYFEAFNSDLIQLEYTKSVLKLGHFAEACANLSQLDKLRLNPIRKYDNPDFLAHLQSGRQKVYDILGDINKRYACYSNDDFMGDIAVLRPKIGLLFELVDETYQKIEQKKQEANLIDYSDLEHYALKLLVNKTESGYEKTKIGQELSENIEQIMVDECQDINEVQNLIFKLLSKNETNIFMVGDVKQSIYRFRQAMPKLFMDKKKQFPIYNPNSHTNSSCGRIILESNFRSRKEVCDTVNYIFTQIMSEDIGEIDYNDEEKLVIGASYEPNENAYPELHIIDYDKDSEEEKSIVEARYTAGLIKKMVSEGFMVTIDGAKQRPCRYKDFAILLRSKKNISTTYAKELTSCGVPCLCDTSEGYFDEYEITVIVNLLKVIDNPLLDIPLLSVLMSPMFGFSVDKIAEIRLAKKNTPIYLALSRLAKQGDAECQGFMRDIELFRKKAALLPTDEIIQEIYDRTDFIAISSVLGSAEKKDANLRLMLSYAKNYEKFGSNGLSGFIRRIDRVIESKQDFSCANTSSKNADSVSILTVHSSKGLEFPICILANCAKGFNKQDINSMPYQMNAELGFSMKITEKENLKSYTSLPFEAIRLKREKEAISEEMRILYVALTRAKEKLIMVMTFENASNKLKNIVDFSAQKEKPSPYEVYSCNSFAEWIITALIRHPDMKDIREEISRSSIKTMPADFKLRSFLVKADEKAAQEQPKSEKTAAAPKELVQSLQNAFDFSYKNEVLTKIPAKLTVTQIAKKSQSSKITLSKRPNFMQKEKITPAQRGTILHSFMQFADFIAAKQSLKNELERLVKQGYLTQEQANSLDKKKITAFLNSSLYEKISQEETMREYKFNFFIKAGDIDKTLSMPFSQEEIFIQGIADCLIIEPDGIIIVDYKTDNVTDPKILAERYYDQLRLYKTAIEDIFDKKVKRCLIYSLQLEKEIEIKI